MHSVSRLRLTPDLPRSVGLGPVFFPTQGRFGQRSVHGEPVPVNPAEFIKAPDSCLPALEKDPCFYPHLKPIVRRRMGTQLGLIQRLPLAASAQDVEDGVGTGAIGHARPSSTKAMGIDVDREERLKYGPEVIRDAKSSGRTVIGRALSLTLLGFLFAHTPYSTTVIRIGCYYKTRSESLPAVLI